MRKLTSKEEQFCQLLESGCSQIDAYNKVYHKDHCTKQTLYEFASRLAKKQKIIDRRAEIRKPVLEKIHYGLAEHLDRLEKLSLAAVKKGNFTAAVNAEIARGKVAGLYVEKIDHTNSDGSLRAPTRIEILAPTK